MNKELSKIRGGKSFLQWWKNPRNRQKVYDSDKQDAEDLRKETEQEQHNSLKETN